MVFLCQRPRFALIQLLVATGLLEEPIKIRLQSVSFLLAGVVLVSQEVSVQHPEALAEGVEPLAMEREVWGQFLVVTKFMDPAQSEFCRQAVELGRIVTE